MSAPSLKKKVFLTESEANKIGMDAAIGKCMDYSLKNNVEVVFKYDMDGKIFDDVFIGIYDFSDSFLTKEQVKRYPSYGTFHTHPGKDHDFFGLSDLGQLTFDEVQEIVLGCPRTNEIITIKKKDFLQLSKQFLQFIAWVQQDMNSKFYLIFSTDDEGRVVKTKFGKKYETELTSVLRKNNASVASFKKWK